jgi:hypothetical protein
VESENRSRDHLRKDDIEKITYAYITPNLGDDINEPRFKEAKSLKVYIDGRSKYKDSYNL